jgi:hypothetical protein
LVFLSVFWVVGWNVCVRLKGWRGKGFVVDSCLLLFKKDVAIKGFSLVKRW